MPIVHECSEAGCTTLTMGELCLEHEVAKQVHPVPLGALQIPAELDAEHVEDLSYVM